MGRDGWRDIQGREATAGEQGRQWGLTWGKVGGDWLWRLLGWAVGGLAEGASVSDVWGQDGQTDGGPLHPERESKREAGLQKKAAGSVLDRRCVSRWV